MIPKWVATDAFGNALGSSIAGSMQQDNARQAYLAADQMRAGAEDAAAYNDAWSSQNAAASSTGSAMDGRGGYAPEDLERAGYPRDALFIDTPTDRNGNPITGVRTGDPVGSDGTRFEIGRTIAGESVRPYDRATPPSFPDWFTVTGTPVIFTSADGKEIVSMQTAEGLFNPAPESSSTSFKQDLDSKYESGTLNVFSEYAPIWRSDLPISEKVSNTWSVFNYVHPPGMEYGNVAPPQPNLRAAAFDNMLSNPFSAIVGGTMAWRGASTENIYYATTATNALGGVAAAGAGVQGYRPAFVGARQMPNLAPWKPIDTSKPYSNPKNRPSYGPGLEDTVWSRAQSRSPDGNVYDPNIRLKLEWDRTKSRAGKWDMGHTPGNEYAELHARYMHGEISLEEFLGRYRNPVNYVPESPSANRSHRYQDH